ncbi:MAG: hypothetical protein HZA34_03805 [Candidatus Pacebacteria bacterium]|nr:hypothetical protein [Candidatus Paceibacterota bacterium]
MVDPKEQGVTVPQELLEAAALTELCRVLEKNRYSFDSFSISNYRNVLADAFDDKFSIMDGETMKQEIKRMLEESADPIHKESAKRIH